MNLTTDGTVTPLAGASPETLDAMLEPVREANGRRAIRPAETVDDAALDVESYLVVPEWSAGQSAADVAADTLREVHGVDARAGQGALAWALYTEAARRLGFPGDVPVPALNSLGTADAGRSAALA